jgi:hypothetical protein
MKLRNEFMQHSLKNTLRRLMTPLLLLVALSAAPSVVWAQDKVIRLEFSPAIDDYSGEIHDILDELFTSGGGTLEIDYGIYPLKKEMNFDRRGKAVDIRIRGLKNAAGERPTFKCIAEEGQTHGMLTFITGYTDKYSLYISGIEIQGNNVPVNRKATNVQYDEGVEPYMMGPDGVLWMNNLPVGKSYGHPFLHHADANGRGLFVANVKNFLLDDSVIREVYGNGIQVGSGNGEVDGYVDSPVITNTRVINSWSWQEGFMTGDGIYIGFAKNPRIENCVIWNDIPYTRWIGRIGVTLEYNCEGGVIRNNLIGGYNSAIHIENTLGGHTVADNKLLACVTGVTLNEPAPAATEPGYAELMAKVKPVVIRNNVMEYAFERQKYKTAGYGGRRSFVDITVGSPKLAGSEISGNTMTFKALPGSDTLGALGNFITDIFPIKDLLVKDNQFISIDGKGNEVDVPGGTSPVWPPTQAQ